MQPTGTSLSRPHIKTIEEAQDLCPKTRENDFELKAASEHAKLLRIQHELEEKTGLIILVDSSIYDTIRNCIVWGFPDEALRVKKEFKVSNERWYAIKVHALVRKKDWDALERFSKESILPNGFKLIVKACIAANQRSEALKYIPKLAAEEQTEAYDQIGVAKETGDAQHTATASIFDTLKNKLGVS